MIGEAREVDHTEVLRLLTIDGAGAQAVGLGGTHDLDAKSQALVRLAALIAVGGGAGPSYGEATDAAVSSGASPAEVVAVLIGVLPVVGMAPWSTPRRRWAWRSATTPTQRSSDPSVADEPDGQRPVDGLGARRDAQLPVDGRHL